MPDAADRDAQFSSAQPASSARPASSAEPAPPACAIDPDTECPVCAARGVRVKMQPVKAHYQCPECRYFDSCCM